MANGLFEGKTLIFHITMHRGTAPKDKHIVIRLISIDSGTFSRHRRLAPTLKKSLQTTDDCIPKLAASHAVSIRTDSVFSNLLFSELLCNFATGTPRGLRENSPTSSNLSVGLTLRWAELSYKHNTLLSFDW